LPNTKIELITPLGRDSPLRNFLKKNPNGGIHHVCYEVRDISESRRKLLESGAKLVGNGELKIGAHGKPVLFLHPKDFDGTLIELEES
jgi:methylmalonyl-CoA/ethylmalonyl-CoA epimerase